MIELKKLPKTRGNVELRYAQGHFATNHSHINYYIDITYQKTRLGDAMDSARQLVSHFINDTPVDTLLCLDGTTVLGTCVAQELTKSGFRTFNKSGSVYILEPELLKYIPETGSCDFGHDLTMIGAAHLCHIVPMCCFEESNLFDDLFKAGMIQLQLKFLIDIAQNRLLLGIVDDLELLGIEYLLNILPKHPNAEPVVCADQGCIVFLADQVTDPPFHFSRSFVGKGHAENVGRVDAVLLHKIGITAHQQFGLAAACTGNHPEIPLSCRHSFQLFFV